jgi:hypothetical protein
MARQWMAVKAFFVLVAFLQENICHFWTHQIIFFCTSLKSTTVSETRWLSAEMKTHSFSPRWSWFRVSSPRLKSWGTWPPIPNGPPHTREPRRGNPKSGPAWRERVSLHFSGKSPCLRHSCRFEWCTKKDNLMRPKMANVLLQECYKHKKSLHCHPLSCHYSSIVWDIEFII